MILQALNDYYDRKQNELPPFGFEEKPIPFIIVINEAGQFVNLETNSVIEDGKEQVRALRVPKAKGRRGAKSYEVAYCLWDHYGYVLAHPKLLKPSAKQDEIDKAISDAKKQHQSFIREVENLNSELLDDVGVRAVRGFLNAKAEIEKLKQHEQWQECIKKPGANLTFRLAGRTELICQSPTVIEWVKSQAAEQSDTKLGLCMITGKTAAIARLHDNISGVNQKPAPLASINDKAYEFYNKDKGFNFPVSVEAVFKYATSLNHLLRNSSPNKFRLKDISHVCWAERANPLETATALFLSAGDDDPDATALAVKALFNSIHNGSYQERDSNDSFYVLGMSPNSARIVVRYWKVGTVAEMSEHFATWFNDIDLIGREHHGYPTLKKILRSGALQFKDDNIPPNLPSDMVRSILAGSRLPETLVQAVLRRIKAEQGHVSYVRACALKAYLNRKYRTFTNNQKELTVALNHEERRVGYCLGRLFAVLERLQQDAHPGLNATIRDRYYSSASTTPKAVFGTLMRMSSHHLKKLENPGWRVNAEKRITEVVGLISEFPSHLNLEHQSMFALGYYHQKQAFFTKKSEQGESA